MAITGFNEGIFTPAGLDFIREIEDQLRTAPHAGPLHTFPEGIDGFERETLFHRFRLIDHYTVTRVPTGLIVVIPEEDD